MSKGVAVTLGILGIISLLPIWRGAGHSRYDGINLWKLIYDSSHLTPESPFGHPHLLYPEAVHRAQEAYWIRVID